MHQGVPEPPMELPNPNGGEPFRLSTIICYEDIAPATGRRLHAMGAPDVILNLTNDAWFGKSSEPYLHMALSTFRAIEQRTWLVRSTNTGVSCFIDANGRIVKQTSLEDAETLLHDVPMLRATTTLYMQFGEWLRWVLVSCLVVVWFMTRQARRSNHEGGTATV
jgi:apolipoprotein N-acyltransferase